MSGSVHQTERTPLSPREAEKAWLRERLGPGLHLWEPWQVVALGFTAGVLLTLLSAGFMAWILKLLNRFCG